MWIEEQKKCYQLLCIICYWELFSWKCPFHCCKIYFYHWVILLYSTISFRSELLMEIRADFLVHHSWGTLFFSAAEAKVPSQKTGIHLWCLIIDTWLLIHLTMRKEAVTKTRSQTLRVKWKKLFLKTRK